jgi:hypothetical protein
MPLPGPVPATPRTQPGSAFRGDLLQEFPAPPDRRQAMRKRQEKPPPLTCDVDDAPGTPT